MKLYITWGCSKQWFARVFPSILGEPPKRTSMIWGSGDFPPKNSSLQAPPTASVLYDVSHLKGPTGSSNQRQVTWSLLPGFWEGGRWWIPEHLSRQLVVEFYQAIWKICKKVIKLDHETTRVKMKTYLKPPPSFCCLQTGSNLAKPRTELSFGLHLEKKVL